MTPPEPLLDDVARIARGLIETQRVDLTTRWDEFCDQDQLSGNRDPDEYTADLLLDGFADIREVEADDLDDPFAWERGIEPGGMIYVLTPLGLAVRQHLISQDEQEER